MLAFFMRIQSSLSVIPNSFAFLEIICAIASAFALRCISAIAGSNADTIPMA